METINRISIHHDRRECKGKRAPWRPMFRGFKEKGVRLLRRLYRRVMFAAAQGGDGPHGPRAVAAAPPLYLAFFLRKEVSPQATEDRGVNFENDSVGKVDEPIGKTKGSPVIAPTTHPKIKNSTPEGMLFLFHTVTRNTPVRRRPRRSGKWQSRSMWRYSGISGTRG